MKPQISSVKKLSADLVAQGDRLLALLKQAELEANQATDSARRKGGLYWARQAIENVAADLNKLGIAIQEKNPTALKHAVRNFSVYGRYIDDYDYSWFSREAEISALLETISHTTAPIIISIDIYDPANLEAVRKALE